MKISTIIISYAKTPDLKKLTEQAIESLRQSEDQHTFEIIVVESGNVDRYDNADKTIRPTGTLNYNSYCNQGAEHATARLIGFFNNDLIFHKGWAEAIVDAFNTNEDLSSASPWCRRSHPDLGIEKNTGLHWGYTIRNHIAGWAILAKRSALQTIGGSLPENVSFWYSDNAYADTLKAHGLHHALVSSSHVMHLESKTLETESKAKQHALTYGQKDAYNRGRGNYK
jgi:GT2 family glycosyltransferase